MGKPHYVAESFLRTFSILVPNFTTYAHQEEKFASTLEYNHVCTWYQVLRVQLVILKYESMSVPSFASD
jgi:hypothetical protein